MRSETSENIPASTAGFYEIRGGGLPRVRITLLSASSGSGRSIFGLNTTVIGAPEFFFAYEENTRRQNPLRVDVRLADETCHQIEQREASQDGIRQRWRSPEPEGKPSE